MWLKWWMPSKVLCDTEVPLKFKGKVLLDYGKNYDVIQNKMLDD